LGPSRQRLSGREHLSFFYKDREEYGCTRWVVE